MDIIQELSKIVPSQNVTNEQDLLTSYGQDWTRFYSPNPRAIVFPSSTEEVQKIVQWANQSKISIVPSGGRTGLSGGAVAKNGEVVLSLDKMSKIYDFNDFDMIVRCQAGVVTETLQKFISDKGYLFPVDFASRGSSQIGGNIATNAGGINVIRYGMMRDWVAGLQVVTGKGDILELNNGLIKNATGYDLRQLFIGSEGTLGIVTEAQLRVTNAPKPSWVLVLGVPDLNSVMNVFKTFRKNLPLTAFELFTDVAMNLVLDNDPKLAKPFETPAPIYLLIEVELLTPNLEEFALSTFEDCANKGWVLDGVVSQSPQQARDLWKLREDISEACSKYTPYKNDISVRISNGTQFMAETDSILKSAYPDLQVVWFGHIGDGNLHINILKPKNIEMKNFIERCQKVDQLLFTTIQKFRGSISAEHGVGLSKKPFLGFTRAPTEITAMRAVKNIFDPNHIMNPGKIFDL